MEQTKRKYNGLDIRILNEKEADCMLNIVDVAKALEINPFKWIEQPEIKEFIHLFNEGFKKVYGKKPKKEIVNIESSEEIYVHHMIFCKLTFKDYLSIYEWFSSEEYLKC